MVLTRPVTKTIISTTDFGQPVYDWIVANTPTPWTNVPLQNGWTPFTQAPLQYRKIGDNVQLRGRAENGAGVAWQIIGTLPAGFRPGKDMNFAMAVVVGVSWGTAMGQINVLGEIVAGSNVVTVSPFVMFSTTP